MAPSSTAVSYAFVLSMLAVAAGCGENVLVGNWQLRSLGDAGVELPEEADAAPNTMADYAQAAREKHKKLKSEQKEDQHERSNGDKANTGH
jgi:Tfp pilus assembly protein PilN